MLTVPIEIAQCITDTMVAGGIRLFGILLLSVSGYLENIVVQNTSLYAHLAVMFNRLNLTNLNNEDYSCRMNYAQHNKELGHTLINKEPVIFMKPDSAILERR